MKVDDKGVNIEIDGIYCSKCNDFHPTLQWHEKYNDYLNKGEWAKQYKKNLLRFKQTISDAEANKQFEKHITSLNIIQKDHAEECIICSTLTNFVNIRSRNFVCSDKCKYKDDNR